MVAENRNVSLSPPFVIRQEIPNCYKGLRVFAAPGVHQEAIAIIKQFLEVDARVIEVGAGAGAFIMRLPETGYQVVASGINPDTFALKGCRMLYSI